MHGCSEGCLNPCFRVCVVGFAAFLLCALLLFTGFVAHTAAHAHVGSVRNVAVYCRTCIALLKLHRTGLTQPLLALSTLGGRPARCQLVTREAQAVVCSATSVWTLLSSCSLRLASLLRLYSFILASVSAVFHVSGSRTKKSLQRQPDRSTRANIK
jgi:hypothetical protein